MKALNKACQISAIVLAVAAFALFFVNCVFFAEPAVLIHFKSVRVILLVFHCVVVALFALCASECNFNSHDGTSRFTDKFSQSVCRPLNYLPPSDEARYSKPSTTY